MGLCDVAAVIARRRSLLQVERGCGQGGMKTSVCRQGGQQHPWDAERGKENMMGQKEEGKSQEKGVSCVCLVPASEEANTRKPTQEETLPPHPMECSFTELWLHQQDITTGWTQYKEIQPENLEICEYEGFLHKPLPGRPQLLPLQEKPRTTLTEACSGPSLCCWNLKVLDKDLSIAVRDSGGPVQGTSQEGWKMSWIISLLQTLRTSSSLWEEGGISELSSSAGKISSSPHLNCSPLLFLPSDSIVSAGSMLLEGVTLWLFYCRYRRQLESDCSSKTVLFAVLIFLWNSWGWKRG